MAQAHVTSSRREESQVLSGLTSLKLFCDLTLLEGRNQGISPSALVAPLADFFCNTNPEFQEHCILHLFYKEIVPPAAVRPWADVSPT